MAESEEKAMIDHQAADQKESNVLDKTLFHMFHERATQTLLEKGFLPGQSYGARVALDLTGWQYHELDYRIKIGLLSPRAVQRGKKVFREFEFADLVEALMVKELEESREDLSVAALRALLMQWKQQDRWPGSSLNQLTRASNHCQARLLYTALHCLCQRELPLNSLLAASRKTSPAQSAEPQGRMVRVTNTEAASILLSEPSIKGLLSAEQEVVVTPTDLNTDQKDFYRISTPRYYLFVGLPVGHQTNFEAQVGAYLDAFEDWDFVETMVDFCLRLRDASVSAPQPPEVSAADNRSQYRQDTFLSAIARLISVAYPALYCLIYGPPYETGNLKLKAVSPNFPIPLNPTLSIIRGRLLSGWAFENGQEIVVQRAEEVDDPRIANQPEERATAALAVPAFAGGQVNGVIYLGTRKPLAPGQDFFAPSLLRLFRVLGAIVGEVIARENLVQKTHEKSAAIASDKTPSPLTWQDFLARLGQVVAALDLDASALQNHRLLIVTVSADLKGTIEGSQAIVSWAMEKLKTVAYHYCRLECHLEKAQVFGHPAHEQEFIILNDRTPFEGISEEEIRAGLSRRLNSFERSLGLTAQVCSLQFGYSELRRRLERDNGPQELRQFLASETLSLLEITKLMAEGDQEERRGQDLRAISRYQHAYRLAPQNIYVIRRLARSWGRRGNYKQALDLYHIALDINEHDVDSLECLGQLYATLQDYEQARETYYQALALRPTSPALHRLIGETFILQGEEFCQQAVDKFREAATYDDIDDPRRQARYYWYAHEAYVRAGLIENALYEIQQALNLDPQNEDYHYALRKALDAQAHRM